MKLTPLQRFEAKVQITPGCWIWRGAKIPRGYGHFGLNGGQIVAHRFSYQTYVGPICDGLFVLHRCDNRACVNPEHLFLGTNKDNMQDMLAKGRGNKARGEAVCNAKLTTAEVAMILKDDRSIKDIAAEYRVNSSTIHRIKKRQTWRHV